MSNLNRFLALGDSYTIGEAVAENERWPMQFISILEQCGVVFETPEIIAKTGWTTDELLLAINTSNPKGPYDLVSLLIGVNNQYRGYGLEAYKIEFELLLNRAIFFAGGDESRVIVISIPDWGATPFAADRDRDKIATEIDAFNEENKTIAFSYGVDYIDITPHSRTARNNQSLTASDNLHPSHFVYTYWAKLISQWYLSKNAKPAG